VLLRSAGQVMLHKRYEYRGVIVGMDPVCQADERWQRVRPCPPPRPVVLCTARPTTLPAFCFETQLHCASKLRCSCVTHSLSCKGAARYAHY